MWFALLEFIHSHAAENKFSFWFVFTVGEAFFFFLYEISRYSQALNGPHWELKQLIGEAQWIRNNDGRPIVFTDDESTG